MANNNSTLFLASNMPQYKAKQQNRTQIRTAATCMFSHFVPIKAHTYTWIMSVIPEHESIFCCQLDMFSSHHCLVSIHILWPSCQVASNNSEILTHITRCMYGNVCNLFSVGKSILPANIIIRFLKWRNMVHVFEFLPQEHSSV
jgi:hypothetical protein